MAEIKQLRYTHEAIADFLIANPMASQGDVARFFEYSEPWLSQIIHSDAFQAYYRRLAQERGVIAVHSLPDKISGLAALALEKATDRLASGTASESFINDTMETTLKALGYLGSGNGSNNGAGAPQQHMHVHVDAEALAEARERAARRYTDGSAQVVEPATS